MDLFYGSVVCLKTADDVPSTSYSATQWLTKRVVWRLPWWMHMSKVKLMSRSEVGWRLWPYSEQKTRLRQLVNNKQTHIVNFFFKIFRYFQISGGNYLMSFKDRAFLSDKATKTNYVAKYIRVSSKSKEKNERKQTVHYSIKEIFIIYFN